MTEPRLNPYSAASYTKDSMATWRFNRVWAGCLFSVGVGLMLMVSLFLGYLLWKDHNLYQCLLLLGFVQFFYIVPLAVLLWTRRAMRAMWGVFLGAGCIFLINLAYWPVIFIPR